MSAKFLKTGIKANDLVAKCSVARPLHLASYLTSKKQNGMNRMKHHNKAKSVLKAFLEKRSKSFPQQFSHDLPHNQAANTSEK